MLTQPIPTYTAERRGENTRLLVFQKAGLQHLQVADLSDLLNTGDVLVVNRSATLPASYRAKILPHGPGFEVRLAAFQGPSPAQPLYWQAIALGAGSWRQSTESRGLAPLLKAGDFLQLGSDLFAHVLAVEHQRLLTLRLESRDLIPALYRSGEPIQYAYHAEPLNTWDQQTLFSGAPLSVEPPSASFAMTAALLHNLQQKGVKVVSLLHSAGISSTGDPEVDRLLPLPEWFDIPEETAQTIRIARQEGQRVVALGTTVMRALESAATAQGGLASGVGLSRLQIRPGYRFQAVNSLITGMHEPESSHMRILESLCDLAFIQKGYREAQALGYRDHEYGDLSWVDCGCSPGAVLA